MRNLFTLSLVLFTIQIYAQKDISEIEKYRDCQLNIPIIGSGCNKKEDIEILEKFSTIQLVIIQTDKYGNIINVFRGHVRMYKTEFGMTPLFVPLEDDETEARSDVLFLMYNCKYTYCLDASCYDEWRKTNK